MGKKYNTFSGTMQNARDPELFDVWIRHENKLKYIRELDIEDIKIFRDALDERLTEDKTEWGSDFGDTYHDYE